MKNIAVIGAGQLGSRHLQALNLVKYQLQIFVIDPNKTALDIAKSRFSETIKNVYHNIHFMTDLKLEHHIHLAIIASTATNRRAIIEALLSQTQVHYLLLEKLLFSNQEDYTAINKLLSQHKTKAWVNCPMRQMPFYSSLKNTFDKKTIQLNVTGSQYGLVTNAIHYLDYMCFLTGDNEFILDLSYLDKKIIPSKRNGYLELTGTMIARFNHASTATIHCGSQGSAPVQVQIFSDHDRVISKEWEQKAWALGEHTDWQWQEKNAEIPFQSQLTSELVNSLFEHGTCLLPNFHTSIKTHLQLLKPLSKFIEVNHGQVPTDYPFT